MLPDWFIGGKAQVIRVCMHESPLGEEVEVEQSLLGEIKHALTLIVLRRWPLWTTYKNQAWSARDDRQWEGLEGHRVHV